MGLPANIHLLSTKIYLLNKTDDEATASAIGIVFILMAILFVVHLQSRDAPHRELQHRHRQGVPAAGDEGRHVPLRRRRAGLGLPGHRRHRAVLRDGLGQHSTVLRGAQPPVGRTHHLRRRTRGSSRIRKALDRAAQHAAADLRRADCDHAACARSSPGTSCALADARQAPARRPGLSAEHHPEHHDRAGAGVPVPDRAMATDSDLRHGV